MAETDTFVRQISVTVAFEFVLASVAVFLLYIDHIAQSIRAATIVTQTGEDGLLAVHVPQATFEDHVCLAVDEIAHWGADSPRVQRRLRAMLIDVQEAALPENRDAVVRALQSLDPARTSPPVSPAPQPTDDHLR